MGKVDLRFLRKGTISMPILLKETLIVIYIVVTIVHPFTLEVRVIIIYLYLFIRLSISYILKDKILLFSLQTF